MKKNEPKNCSECKFNKMGKCTKTKERINPIDWCAAGRKK